MTDTNEETITIRDLRENLTTYLTSASASTSYTVTRFGKPIAIITRVYQQDPVDASAPDRRPVPERLTMRDG
jgi:antitoxin (DNA-binding transcriptional repressor) of toxin-antitoxin stability system